MTSILDHYIANAKRLHTLTESERVELERCTDWESFTSFTARLSDTQVALIITSK